MSFISTLSGAFANSNFSKADILNEALNQARVEDLGLNVPKILEVGAIDGRWAIVSEFIEGQTLSHLMRDDPDVITVGIPALRMQCAALLFMPLCLSGNMLFQSIGKSGRAILLSSIRSGLLFIPVLLITSRLFGIPGIQMSQALADTLSGLIAAPMIYDFFRKL